MDLNEFKPHSKSKSKRWVGISLVALVAIGGVIYYTWPREVAGEDTPPVLEMSTSALQGAFVDDKIAFYNFEQKDQDDWEAESRGVILSDNCGSPNDLMPGIKIHWSKSPRTIGDIRDFIVPVNGNQIFIAYYDTIKRKFVTHPKGPFAGTEEGELSYEIPAYKGFFIINKDKTEVYCVETEADSAVQFPTPLKSNEKGWTLVVATDNANEMETVIGERIALDASGKPQMWAMTFENKFEKVESIPTDGTYKMIWLKLEEKKSVSPAP